jgi:glycosyltransferase involved in cell wall biosynthesis
MRTEPLVSSVIIFLDAEQYIEEAIESVFRQTYRNWELLLVDDGSRDRSLEIARRYAAAHCPRVRYLEHENHANLGMSASRNLGVRHSHGDYIAFLDSDDVWLPRKTEEQAAILKEQRSAGMVYGKTEYWYSHSSAERRRDYVFDLGIPANTLVQPPALLTLFLRGQVRTPCPSDIMVRRSTIEGVGGFDDDFRGLYEDQAFLAKAYLNTPVFVAGEHWSRHRRHSNSFMAVARRTAPKHPSGIAYLEWLESQLAQEGVADPDLWEALRGKKWRYQHPTLHRLWRWFRRPARWAVSMTRRMAGRLVHGNFRAQRERRRVDDK